MSDQPSPQPAPVPPPAAVPSRPSGGSLSWALGFVMLAPLPFLNVLASGIVMASVYGAVAKHGALARDNARAAANWGITFTIISTLLLAAHFLLLFTFAGGDGVSDFYPLGIPITLYGAVVLLHLVLVIVGTVRAGSGKRMRVPFAVPFIRG